MTNAFKCIYPFLPLFHQVLLIRGSETSGQCGTFQVPTTDPDHFCCQSDQDFLLKCCWIWMGPEVWYSYFYEGHSNSDFGYFCRRFEWNRISIQCFETMRWTGSFCQILKRKIMENDSILFEISNWKWKEKSWNEYLKLIRFRNVFLI